VVNSCDPAVSGEGFYYALRSPPARWSAHRGNVAENAGGWLLPQYGVTSYHVLEPGGVLARWPMNQRLAFVWRDAGLDCVVCHRSEGTLRMCPRPITLRSAPTGDR